MVGSDVAVIIGNGPSRLDLELNELKDHFTIGCNAIHREWQPTYITAIDGPMIEELCVSSAFRPPNRTRPLIPHWTLHHEYDFWNIGRRDHAIPPRNNVGMVAINLAIQRFNYDQLILIGFDGFYDDLPATGNVYAGTNCYTGQTSANERDVIKRVEYMHFYVGRMFRHVRYIFASDKGQRLRDGLGDYRNVVNVDFDTMRSVLDANV